MNTPKFKTGDKVVISKEKEFYDDYNGEVLTVKNILDWNEEVVWYNVGSYNTPENEIEFASKLHKALA